MKSYVLIFANGYKYPITETTSENNRAFRKRIRREWSDIANVIFK